jgi:protein-L-isoaspartate(D-aspartate) O-methyltransferase
MVENQMRRRGIRDERVLAALEAVPRHRFVAEALADRAYDDNPLPIGFGQTISQPYMVAFMTEVLRLSGRESVLEIGTGSGYQTAVLSLLSRVVYTVERIPGLAETSRRLLRNDLGYRNVYVVQGDGTLGHPDHAPYDRILVTAGAPEIGEALKRQLSPGGVMVIPVGGREVQELAVVEKGMDGRTRDTRSIGCRFVPLVGAQGWPDTEGDRNRW